MRYFPVFLDLRARPVLVVGRSRAADAKAELLARSGAEVVRADGGEADGPHLLSARDWALVVAAAGDARVDGAVAAAARAAGVAVNVVDRPELSSFVMGAVIDRDPLIVAVGSAGAAPVLSRRIRETIEALLPARVGDLARFAASFRTTVRAAVADPGARRRFWQRVFDGPVSAHMLAGDEPAARRALDDLLARPEGAALWPVALVGAGPGDPDLLTLRALRLLQDADVIVHDRLVPPAILERARRDAQRIGVGKTPGGPSARQEDINALLVAKAREGLRVVRLKAGDPLVFARGGEEIDALRAAGIEVEVVPGVTAATAAAAAAVMPLTHRGIAQAVTFVTGQARDGEPDLDWSALARLGHTIVAYMGVAAAPRLARRLIAAGMPANTPVAVVENASRPGERVLAATLAGLAPRLALARVDGPAVLVIGAVAAHAELARDAARDAAAAAPLQLAS